MVSIQKAEVLQESCRQRTCGSGGVEGDRTLLSYAVGQGKVGCLGITPGHMNRLRTQALGLCCTREKEDKSQVVDKLIHADIKMILVLNRVNSNLDADFRLLRSAAILF